MLRIGATAFGGGSATIVAMRQLALRKSWMTEEEFLETVVLSRVTPGITILAQVILIGKRVDGARGAVAGLIGMLLPSITITILLAKLYVVLQDKPWSAHPMQMVAAVAPASPWPWPCCCSRTPSRSTGTGADRWHFWPTSASARSCPIRC